MEPAVKKQWVDFASCWTIVVHGSSGDGGSCHGSDHGSYAAGLPASKHGGIPGAAWLAQVLRKVTKNGEATSKASGRAGLPCHS